MVDDVLARLTAAYEGARDPERAPGMAAYMKGRFPFLGIATPERRVLDRAVLAGVGRPDDDDVVALARACWAKPEREYQYFAVDRLVRWPAATIDVARELITTKSWWDTVDPLAIHVVGRLVRERAELRPVMAECIDSDDLWLARTAILHQEKWKADTDPAVLFDFCLRRAGDREFFLRKAIGWALRSYAATDPDAVAAFVAAHEDELSGLSKREALRNVDRTTWTTL